MKNTLHICIAVAISLISTGPLAGAPTAADKQISAVPSPTPYSVVGRDANSRVWERTTYELSPAGSVVPQTNRYVELATGLHYQKNGQWVESKEQIDILPNGTAAATHGQHQAYFPGNIYQGVVELVTQDGKRLRSRPLGLSYDDGSQTVLIAELKDSVGQLVGPNQVIYPDAFTDFKADLRYTYTKAGFEQDIILREQPPTPESFGLNPATARLQVLSEFFDVPQPAVTTARLPKHAGRPLSDENLDFGAMKMLPGRAFLLGSNAHEGGVSVSKSWVQLAGRQFLVEEVPVKALVDELVQLPVPQAASIKPNVNSTLHVVSAKRLLPAPRLVETSPGGQLKQVAQAATSSRGLVLDYYVTLNSNTNNFTFQGDTTYYISSAVNLGGTSTFEGGAVLKYAVNASLNVIGAAQFNWLATAYRPVVFTAKDDNSVGQNISGSTGNPVNYSYANPALNFTSFSPSISHFRIAFAQQAIALSSSSTTFCDGQIVNCAGGILVGCANAHLRNLLFANVLTALSLAWADVDAENVTFGGSTSAAAVLMYGQTAYPWTPWNVSFKNCIIANYWSGFVRGEMGSPTGDHDGYYNNYDNPSVPTWETYPITTSINPFQTVGAGNYYLTNGCNFLNAGTTSIDATLLADLQQKTTHSPIVVSNVTISTGANWAPTVQRDTDVPDLGYHYDPLDYLCSQITISGPSLLLTNGVAVGLFGTAGFNIGMNGLKSSGQVNAMNHLVWYPAVQEQPLRINGVSTTGSSIFSLTGPASPRYVTLNFTDLPMQGSPQPLFYYPNNTFNFPIITLKNCWLRGVAFSIGSYQANGFAGSGVTLQNNLMERSTVTLYNGYLYMGGNNYLQNPLGVALYNNLFWHGSLNLSYYNSHATYAVQWTIKDNLFDTTSFSFSGDGSYAYVSVSNNGYYQTSDALPGANDLNPITSLTYAAGPLGPWYIGSSSPALVDMGSRGAGLAGLYHYTMFANLVNGCEVKEANTIVDIGFHYVATDANGSPIDSNGDGIPDYLEDANGNGLADNGETPWMPPPTITVEPANQTVIIGNSATFSVTATSGGLNYQWYSSSGALLNQTNATLTLNNVQATDAGNYYVVVANAAGSVTSSTATLTVWPGTISQQPLSQTVAYGDTVTFSVNVNSSNPLTYQWTFNGSPIAGATGSSYTIDQVQNADTGDYAVIVENMLTSSTATLTTTGDTGDPYLIPIYSQRQDYTFKSGVTYYIGSSYQLYGNTTIEGGAVLKFDFGYNPTLQVMGSLTCKTEQYYPAILTSSEDDAVGDYVWWNYYYDENDGFPHTAENGVPYLDLSASSSSSVENLRICFADKGIVTPSGRFDAWDCQFLSNNVATFASPGATVSFHNVLFAGCGTAVGALNNFSEIDAEQVTANVANFWSAPSPPVRINLTNSIILGTLASGPVVSVQNVALDPTGTVFQTLDYASYYLADNTYRQAGTINISPQLLAELGGKTTYPPVAFSPIMQISGNLSLFPAVPRYTSGAPDLGYYYAALDYTVAGVALAVGSSITVEPGTVIAVANDYLPAYDGFTIGGFDLREGSSFVSHGTPVTPNIFTTENMIQETPETLCSVYKIWYYPDNFPIYAAWEFWWYWYSTITFIPDFEPDGQNTPAPALDFRFTKFYLPAHDYHIWAGYNEDHSMEMSFDSAVYLNLQDCTLRGGRINLGNPDYFYLYDDDYVYAPGAVSWTNDTFDNVNINLDPTYYEYGWDDLGLNVNLSFAAYNNLFRGSLWFHLEPIPASAGNWMLQDNLFDKVDIVQDLNIAPINQPLDYDYNGYWPLSASALNWDAYFIPPWGTEEYWGFAYCAIANTSQLQPTTTGDGFTDGGHEVVLTAPPPYQTSFFGNYYLPINTPLYGAGSTTAGALGLYHYTTRIDQVKEGDEPAGHKVNIGVHYVAADLATELPKDTDGDGIPDYVEDANGNGVVDPNETDWNNPMSDGVTPDAYNTAYDNIDLDGDGLTGRAERILGTDPLIPDNPLTLTPVITGQEPYILTYSMPLSIDVDSDQCVLTLLDNGYPAGGYDFVQQLDGTYLVEWNTTFAANGSHILQVELGMPGSHLPLNDDGTEPVQPVLSVEGTARIENVDNILQIDSGTTSFGSQVWYSGTLAVQSADYEIDIYDTSSVLLKTITGHTDDGTIDEVWDLIADGGDTCSDDEFDALVYITPTGASQNTQSHLQENALTPLGPIPIYKFKTYSVADLFTLAYGWNTLSCHAARSDMMRLDVEDVLFNPSLDNQYFPPFPYLNCWDCDSYFMFTVNDQPALLNDLGNLGVGNFFFNGHGSDWSFGSQGNNVNNAPDGTPLSSVGSAQIRRTLHNGFAHGAPRNKHPYRLVIIDACETAKNDILATAFGIDGKLHNLQWFQKNGLSPQAFVGWSTVTYSWDNSTAIDEYAYHLGLLFNLWMSEVPLANCLEAATVKQILNPLDRPLDPNWKIYGYPFLTRSPQ